PCALGAGFFFHIEKGETAEVLIGSIRFFPEKASTRCTDRDVEVEIAVIIIVAEAVSVLVSPCVKTGRSEDIGKGTVAVVFVEIRTAIIVVIHPKIEVAISVEVTPGEIPEWRSAFG